MHDPVFDLARHPTIFLSTHFPSARESPGAHSEHSPLGCMKALQQSELSAGGKYAQILPSLA
jgi:hypothetical protein